jgi:RNA-directed DNA polymerase
MSLSPQTKRIRARVYEMTKGGRKHWDLHRYLLDPFLLFDATCLVLKNGGAPGLDGKTVESIKGKEWDYAKRLSERLREKRFTVGAVRRRHIAKKDGSLRPLGIPNMEDRVVQRALVLLLEMIYEQKFCDFSYGFRPNRRARDCVAMVAKTVYSHRHVLEADIASFFDKVNHNKLLSLMEQEIVDPRILKLISQILKSGFQEPGKPWQPSVEGTPQGGPLSPLLANIYLHHMLDERFKASFGNESTVKMFRYADDFVVVATTQSKLKTARQLLYVWMHEARLELKESKTREVNMCNDARSHQSKFDFLGFKIHLRAFDDNPQRFWVARQPSEKARKSLREKLKIKMQPQYSLAKVRVILEQTWRGWCEYFRYSNANRVFYRECNTLARLVMRYLKRKFRRQRRPVPWSRLQILAADLLCNLRPPRVITDHLRHEGQTSFNFGRA